MTHVGKGLKTVIVGCLTEDPNSLFGAREIRTSYFPHTNFSQKFTELEVMDRVKTVPNFQISGSFVDPNSKYV